MIWFLGLDHRFGHDNVYPGGVRLALLTLLLNYFAITGCCQKHNNTSLTPSNNQFLTSGRHDDQGRFLSRATEKVEVRLNPMS
jgi:hypothetical protein